MEKFHERYPDYGFHKNKGYPTKEHLQNLRRYGPTAFHRLTFKPVLEMLTEELLAKIVSRDSQRFSVVLRKMNRLVSST